MIMIKLLIGILNSLENLIVSSCQISEKIAVIFGVSRKNSLICTWFNNIIEVLFIRRKFWYIKEENINSGEGKNVIQKVTRIDVVRNN